MASVKQSRFHLRTQNNNHKSHRLHLHRLHLHGRKKSVQETVHVSNITEENQSSQNQTEEQIRQSQLIQQYVLSKLEVYASKSRLWQLTHSSHIKRRILDKSEHISNLYSLANDFVRESINELFTNFDKHVLQLRRLIDTTSRISSQPNILFQNVRKTNNRWRSLELARSQEIFPNIDNEQLTENELLQKYYKHIIETLTPKRDAADTNCTAQLREQPFDLNHAYEQAESKGKNYLINMLSSYHERSYPDLDLIQEMVNLSLKHMKTRPANEAFENATSLLAKISVFNKTKLAYESGLHNMGDDFMLLRFGKIFGANALPTTARSNGQFIYLVHLFIKSVTQLMMMMRTTDDDAGENFFTLSSVISNLFFVETNSSIIKLNQDDFFSPQFHVDQWTWLLEKWRDALRTFPMMLTKVGAFGRLLRTTVGIGIARLFNFAETIIANNQMLDLNTMNEQLFHALQMGFYFGVAYSIVDCVQDEIRNLEKIASHHLAIFAMNKDTNEKLLTPIEFVDKCLLIMEDLLSGREFDRKELPKTPMTSLLLETFDSLITLTKSIDITSAAFNELALLLRSQRMDKKTTEKFYDDEELFIGAILKSHFTYTSTTYLGNIKSAREESERIWIMPFLGQLTDDCRDFYDDVISNSVTPFTHYASFIGRQQASDKHLLNPFFAFLYVCTDLYKSSNSDIQTGAFLGRRIVRTLRSIEINAGESALREFLYIFCQDNLQLHDYCSKILRSQFSNVGDPDKAFFRAVNTASIQYARTNRKLETFVGDHLKQIEDALQIHSLNKTQTTNNRAEQLLLSAMNYSVKAGGKRLRPLLMIMVSDLYNLDTKTIMPLVCAIEYLHTSSLILDDLPAQDNSDLRRGQPTLHKATIDDDMPVSLCEGRAQLAAVDLIAVSMSLINHDLVRNGFPPENVNQLISEISLSMHDLCIGQMMDLRAAHMGIETGNGQLDELDCVAWLKTGKAIEIVLIAPAILAIAPSDSKLIELARIRELGRLIGILFQMRDDLLDIEGENIGKPVALDLKNNTVTYVSTLGVEGTRQRLKEFRRQTLQLVDECWPSGAGTIKEVINYIVDRKN